MTKIRLIAGADEVGRGPLAGPVYASAVLIDCCNRIIGVDDSKKISESKRQYLANKIMEKSICFSFGFATVEEIDLLNIHQSSLLAIERAITALKVKPDCVFIDGKFVPKNIKNNCYPIIKADIIHYPTSCASILAKIKRDKVMCNFHNNFPEYGFDKNKGYPTKHHLDAIAKYGITEIHRKTFNPIKRLLGSKHE